MNKCTFEVPEADVFYYAFGAMTNQRIMNAVAGACVQAVGEYAILEGYGLAHQELHSIPGEIGNLDTPQGILQKVWVDGKGLETFSSYAQMRATDRRTLGKVWALTQDQYDRVAEWEFYPGKSSPAWFDPMTAEVEIVFGLSEQSQKLKVVTDTIVGQRADWVQSEYAELVEPPLLIPEHMVVAHAHDVYRHAD